MRTHYPNRDVDRAGRSALQTLRERLGQMGGAIGLQVADAIAVEEGGAIAFEGNIGRSQE